jgi:acetolactate synthase-1/2/3 large subunit
VNVSDYIVKSLANQGVRDFFLLPGGGCMYLVDAIARSSEVRPMPMLHEQSVGIAAEAYAQFKNSLGVALVTTGPGATNAITPCAAAWTDSTPVIFISGQVKTQDRRETYGVRQLGFQEVPIVEMVSSITKKAVQITKLESIPEILTDLITTAISDRPGPVWLDIPLDIQSQVMAASPLELIQPATSDLNLDTALLDEILNKWKSANRPLLMLGNGVRLSDAVDDARLLVSGSQTPTLLTWKALDILDSSDPLNAGRPGAIAQRWSNFAQQTADFILVIGARLDFGQTAYRPENFAPSASKYIVDVDSNELSKLENVSATFINADAGIFIKNMTERIQELAPTTVRQSWTERICKWKEDYPLIQPKHLAPKSGVNLYHFISELSKLMSPDDLLVPGSSGACSEISMQAFQNKVGQRVLNSEGLGPMGFGIAAPIGACLASKGRRTVSIDGDGGFLMNIQELATLEFSKLPIKIIVLNNNGYGSIKTSQDRYFEGRRLGTDRSSLLGIPQLEGLVRGFNLPYFKIESRSEMIDKLNECLNLDGPGIIELIVDPDQSTEPRVYTEISNDGQFKTSNMERLSPVLDEEELLKALKIN